jgi:malate dehydrogenase (oxaloacetate-decarboxylating)
MTMRVLLEGNRGVGQVASAISDAGGAVVALDVVEAGRSGVVVDITCHATDTEHAKALADAVRSVPGARIRAISDRTLLLHLGGKLEVTPKIPLRTRDDLSMAYTPGVARVCTAIIDNPEAARNLTIKRNTVAVVTDGSAVLGLGNIGPEAALPVMEGKALLFKRFADIDAWPVCLATQDSDEIVRTVELISPVYGGINLEDIAAPRCFDIERRLRDALDIPVFHDDQHGTSIVVLAALINALKVVGKQMADVRAVVLGAGAAGVAIIKMLLAQGIGEIVAVDRQGILHPDLDGLDPDRSWVALHTNQRRLRGGLAEAMVGADVFIGVSGPRVLDEEMLSSMGPDPIVFALANPEPEIDPLIARRHAAVVATGRSDEPNQINNVLAFPGVFRGALDAHATEITTEMNIAAANALAGVVSEDELSPDYIVPTVFNPQVVPAVASAVAAAAQTKRPT